MKEDKYIMNIRRAGIRTLAFAVIVMILTSTVGCGGITTKKISASDLTGKHYSEVIKKISAAGFTNIEKNEIEDLSSENKAKDGIVETVEVSGNAFFDDLNSYNKDARIVISYHTTPKLVVPVSQSEIQTLDNKEIAKLFTDAGFKNVTMQEEHDLNPQETVSECVNEVRIDGVSEFAKGAKVPFDSKVAVISHYPYSVHKAAISIDFDANLIFSRYGVDFYIDGEKQDSLAHGQDAQYEYTLKEGEYTLKFVKTGSSDVKGEIKLKVTDDVTAVYRIHCTSEYVEVTAVSLAYGEQNEEPSPSPTSGLAQDPTPTNILIPTSGEEAFDLDKDLVVVMCDKDPKRTNMYVIVFAEVGADGKTGQMYAFDAYEGLINPRDMGKEFNVIGPLPDWFYVGAKVHVRANLSGSGISTSKCSVTKPTGNNKSTPTPQPSPSLSPTPSPTVSQDPTPIPTPDLYPKYMDVKGKDVYAALIKGEKTGRDYSGGSGDWYEYQTSINGVDVEVDCEGKNGKIFMAMVMDIGGTGQTDLFYKLLKVMLSGDDLTAATQWLKENIGTEDAIRFGNAYLVLKVLTNKFPVLYITDMAHFSYI